LSEQFVKNISHVKDLILSEVNVKELEILAEDNAVLVKSIKPNFKTIGPKYGKLMKAISQLVATFGQEEIASIEKNQGWQGTIENDAVHLDLVDFEIVAQDIPGWLVATEGGLTVALDITLTDELRAEGIAREVVNRVQNLRKDSGLDVTDRIKLTIDTTALIQQAVETNMTYICNEVLANEIHFSKVSNASLLTDIELEGDTGLLLEVEN
jgi:isoleucyl-tRNA synthetase